MRFYLHKIILNTALMAGAGLFSYAQDSPLKKDSLTSRLSPLFISAYKNPQPLRPVVKPPYKTYTPRPTDGLMRWPNYPLTAEQIAARDRYYDQPLGKQIAEEIIGSYLNGILNGRIRKPVAGIPKF